MCNTVAVSIYNFTNPMNKVSTFASLLLGAVLLASCSSATTGPSATNEPWIKGDANSSVILSEYSDLQCPACKSAEPSVKAILAEFGNQIRFEYHHFPLKEMHKNAVDAAIATEAAGKQGKFWEMKDKIFENQTDWAESTSAKEMFKTYANELELNAETFAADLADPVLKAKVDAGRRDGEIKNVNSTPTFFLNGQKIRPTNLDDFKNLVREAVESAS